MSKSDPATQEMLSIKLFFKESPKDVTDDEVAYFRQHPDEIDEITAPINIHKSFLWFGLLFGTIFTAASKMLAYSALLDFHQGTKEFVVDIIFEVGVALIGAAITAFILGILLNRQQQIAAEWRVEVRRRISETEDGG